MSYATGSSLVVYGSCHVNSMLVVGRRLNLVVRVVCVLVRVSRSDRLYSNNRSTEGVNGRIKRLRGIAFGSTDFWNYRTMSTTYFGLIQHALQYLL